MSKDRALTAGEIALAKIIYKDSIDYGRVKVHNHKKHFFQPKNAGMTPNGNMYMAKNVYVADYSHTNGIGQAFFIHEMAHVWQYQLRVLNPRWAAIGEFFEHLFQYGKAYYYTLEPNKDLLDYDIEQQAAILEDYFYTTRFNTKPYSPHMKNDYNTVVKEKLFDKVLMKFLANPSYARHKKKSKSGVELSESNILPRKHNQVKSR